MKEKYLYNNCSELPMHNFFELIKNKDLSFLVKKKNKAELFSEDELQNKLIDIISEYNELTDNTDILREGKSKLNIEFLEMRYNLTKKILSLYLESEAIEVLLTLKDLQWSIDITKPFNPQIARINKALIGLKNKINIEKSKFIKKFKKEEKQNTTPNFDLQEQVLKLEINLPLNYKVNIYKDSIKKYVLWNDILEKKYKAIKDGQVKP